MAINFPTNPILGDTYSSNNILFRYDGTRWLVETAVSDVIQFVRTGTLEQRPVVTQPTLYYNTTTQALEFYDVEFSQWSPISMLSPLVNPTTVTGQITYTIPGIHSWVCPSEVYYVSVVCVGAGGWGARDISGGGGGGGGGLAWLNSIPVNPGESYTVQVGNSGATESATSSFFISDSTVCGFGGASTSFSSGGNGGNFFTTIGPGGGGFGGSGGYRTSVNRVGGGGGAGGYSGNGGNGGNELEAGSSGSGGAGGGGGSTSSTDGNAGGGGGVGLLGEGASGAGGSVLTSSGGGGGGGSGGSSGARTSGFGGFYGGGGGGVDYSGTNKGRAIGGDGAVRIIWGPNRAFPSTNTGDL
jgi:hypothetical protein